MTRLFSLLLFLLLLAPLAGAEEGTTLNDASLEQTLTGMGLAPKKLNKGFLVMTEVDTWKLYVQVVLSADGLKVGFNANLGSVAEEKVTAAQWMELMAANADIDPSTFYYGRTQKKLYIHRAIDNRSLTPAILRTQLDRFMGQVRSTEKTWSPICN